MILKRFLIFFFILMAHVSYSRIDSLEYHVQGYAALGTAGYPPHWIVSNRYGMFNDTTANFMLVPGFSMPMSFGKKFGIEIGFDAAFTLNVKGNFIYQG